MRKVISLLAVILLLTTGVVAFAQDGMDDMQGEYCGELSEADCELLNSADGTLPLSTGFEAAFAVSVTTPEETVDFGVTATGGYVYDEAQRDEILQGVRDTTLLEFNADTTLQLIESGLDAFDAELLITITPPAGSVPPMFSEIPVNLWLVDGVGYVDLSPAAVFEPSLEGVFGMDMIEAARFGLSQVTVGDILDGIAEMGDDFDMHDDFGMMMEGGMGENPVAEAFNNQVQLTPEEAEAFIESILTIERVEDTEIDGVTVAQFEFEIDLATVFASEPFLEGYSLNAPEDVPFTAEEFSEAMIAALGDDSSMVVTMMIAEEDGFIYGQMVELDMTLDLNPLVELTGEELDTTAEGEVIDTVSINFSSTFQRFDVNEWDAISLPDDAVVFTVEDLIEMMEGGMDGSDA